MTTNNVCLQQKQSHKLSSYKIVLNAVKKLSLEEKTAIASSVIYTRCPE